MREARRLGANQPTFCRAEQPLALLIDPAPQPMESTVTAPWVVYNRGQEVRLELLSAEPVIGGGRKKTFQCSER